VHRALVLRIRLGLGGGSSAGIVRAAAGKALAQHSRKHGERIGAGRVQAIRVKSLVVVGERGARGRGRAASTGFRFERLGPSWIAGTALVRADSGVRPACNRDPRRTWCSASASHCLRSSRRRRDW
jgi:hypothetical protein